MDDFEVPPTKLDENDFRKPSLPLMPSSTNSSTSSLVLPGATGPPTVPSPLSSPGATASSTNKDFNLLKESNNNKQAVPANNNTMPGPTTTVHPPKKDSKDPKRKSLKEKLIQLPRKKELHRTIDRLQPGKSKGNLLVNIQNINKPEELFPLGNPNRVKEIKNSLIVKTDESGPKLSLGTVLNTEGFGLVQQHNFNDDEKKEKEEPEITKEKEEEEKTTDAPLATDSKAEEPEKKEKSEEAKDAKVDVGAWFKAFGVSKKPKKPEEDNPMKNDVNLEGTGESLKVSDSPNLNLPGAQKQRRLSTGSTISERSSFSQDPDSPRIAIDERIGAPAPYPSPIGASPIMASPKTDDLQKASVPGTTQNYPLNGSIRVGFYQDMISTKSSPEKSCSPREMPSPYPQYSHMYSQQSGSSSSPNVYWNNQPGATTPDMPSKTPTYSKQTASPASYYDQYKQPMSQESDFNSSMSPTTNPNSPYHSQQSSPYQQQPNSPYQQQQQQQPTFQQQQPPKNGNVNSGNGGNNATAPSGSQQPHSPYSQPNSPFQQPQAMQQQQQQQQMMNEVSFLFSNFFLIF